MQVKYNCVYCCSNQEINIDEFLKEGKQSIKCPHCDTDLLVHSADIKFQPIVYAEKFNKEN